MKLTKEIEDIKARKSRDMKKLKEIQTYMKNNLDVPSHLELIKKRKGRILSEYNKILRDIEDFKRA